MIEHPAKDAFKIVNRAHGTHRTSFQKKHMIIKCRTRVDYIFTHAAKNHSGMPVAALCTLEMEPY